MCEGEEDRMHVKMTWAKNIDEHIHRNEGTHLSLLMRLSLNREIVNHET